MLLGGGDAEGSRLTNNVLGGLSVRFGGGRRCDTQQFIVARDQVTIFVQVADNEVGSFADLRTQAQGTKLPGKVVRQVRWLRQEVFKRRPFDVFHLAMGTVSRIEIILEEGTEINLFEG